MLPLPNANHLLNQQHASAKPTLTPSPSSRYSSILNRAGQVPPCGSRSVRGWSGALLNDDQSFPNLKDVRGALCQVRYPEKDNLLKIILLLFHLVLCLLMFVLYMNATINKVKQKSRFQLCYNIFAEHELYDSTLETIGITLLIIGNRLFYARKFKLNNNPLKKIQF